MDDGIENNIITFEINLNVCSLSFYILIFGLYFFIQYINAIYIFM